MSECPKCTVDRLGKQREIKRLAKLAAKWFGDPRGDQYRAQHAAVKATLDATPECTHEWDAAGTPRTSRMGKRADLTPADRADIARRYALGESIRAIAADYGWSRGAISRIIGGHSDAPRRQVTTIKGRPAPKLTAAERIAEIDAWNAANQRARDAYRGSRA